MNEFRDANRILRASSPSAGFSLVEVLAVLAILGLLMSVAIMSTGRQTDRARVAETRARMAQLENLITSYELKFGDYPADTLKDLKIKSENDLNEGIEACVAALHSKDYPGGTLLSEETLGNTDEDSTSTAFHREGSSYLLEVVDSWENPIAYFHNSSYGSLGVIQLSEPEIREDPERVVESVVSEKTGIHANSDSYQLISAGPDEEFGTEDDITNF